MVGKVLGISAHYHDASAALIVDGKLVAAAAEERFTGLKHDPNFPALAIRFCLETAGLAPDALDAIVFYEDPALKFSRVLLSALAGFPGSRRFYVNAMTTWLKESLWTASNIAAELDVPPRLVHTVGHHESHAAQAFAVAPVAEAAVLTVDAVGEWTTASIAQASRHDGATLRVLETADYPNSLGLAYAAFTGFLGFRPNDQEANTMALAGFGQPRFADQVRHVIRAQADGWFDIPAGYFNFLADGPHLFTRRFTDLFGEPRDARQSLPFDALDGASGVIDADAQRYADIAASIQQVFEDIVLGMAARARTLTGLPNLCLAGGGALNVRANTRVIESGLFEQTYVPSDPGDGGGAVGAAWLGYKKLTGMAPVLDASPYLGKTCDYGLDAGLIARLRPDNWDRGIVADLAVPTGLSQVDCQSGDDLVALVADELCAGRIVGWAQGRFEFGPRGLGARSILADPGDLVAVRRLSRSVKRRAGFRPYALSLRQQDVATLFDWQGTIPDPARRMKMVLRARPAERHRIAGALHFDGTCRVQVVAPDDHPLLHALLDRLAALTGCGAVLNTSFNEAGYPIVSSPTEALAVFARCDMDALAVGYCLLRKSGAGAAASVAPALPRAARV